MTAMVFTRIRTTIICLVALLSAGYLLFVGVSLSTLAEIRINGPLSDKLIYSQDLIADVIPPPLKEISETIRMTQTETTSAVTAMKEATDEGLDRSKADGVRLETIANTVNDLTTMVQRIAQTISTQSASTLEVSHNIDGLVHVLRQGEQRLSDLTMASQRLAGISSELWQAVGALKMKG